MSILGWLLERALIMRMPSAAVCVQVPTRRSACHSKGGLVPSPAGVVPMPTPEVGAKRALELAVGQVVTSNHGHLSLIPICVTNTSKLTFCAQLLILSARDTGSQPVEVLQIEEEPHPDGQWKKCE